MKVKKVGLCPLQVSSHLRFYKKSQYWDRETIERYQLQCVRNILNHAGLNVPYYRELFRSIKFDPQKFRSLKDLEQIPLLDKEPIRRDPKQFIADNIQTIHGYWSYTCGSTGTPLKFFIDKKGHINKYAATLRAYNWAGYSPGKRALIIAEPDKKKCGYRFRSNSLLIDAGEINCESVAKFSRQIRRFRPNYFIGFGRALLNLYKYLLELKLDIPSLKSIISYGENIHDSDKEKLERFYHATYYDFYSNREHMVMAAEPEPGKKYLMEDFFYPEMIDDKNQIIEEGTGELIGTGFYNYTMPLIRYKTGDIFTIKKYSEGNIHKFTEVVNIQGRINDKIVTPSGREYYFFYYPLYGRSGIIAFQFIQENQDSIKINLITDDDFKKESKEEIKRGYQEYIGEPMSIDVQIVDKLEERGAGKRPVIISRLN